MFGTTRGMLVPAGKVLLAFTVALAFGAPLAARADDGMVDVRTLPRLEGAVEDTARTEAHSSALRRSDRGRDHIGGDPEAVGRQRLDAIFAADG